MTSSDRERHGQHEDERARHSIRKRLTELEERAGRLEHERDRYRAALERIARAESGAWGRVAHEALRG